MEAQKRASNLVIQYSAFAIGQAAVGSHFVDPFAPKEFFLKSVEELTTTSSPEEAFAKGTVAAATIILSAAASADPNASLTFGGFLIVLVQNVLFPGALAIFVPNLGIVYLLKKFIIRLVAEIRVERKRKKLNLPKTSILKILKDILKNFRNKEQKAFIFKYYRFKKRKFKVKSRQISLPVIYKKELIIEPRPTHVQPTNTPIFILVKVIGAK